ncbi:GNAT family N-acetyltransferase [Actinomadura rayongensis]|uniref:GNAT family N-acetyltransferase n=1 Tax=Actinomadura rayongensis TaxID=1429076 RepID=A0A6I4W9S3_9ACTN|nr:GNAT family protein [Actinomadura rayongensis]MXQ65923.1 GNAT family N-acetyltransferase [Actinomadura rayongensis]
MTGRFGDPVRLEGERTVLRPFSVDDAEDYVAVLRAGEDWLPPNFPRELDAERLAWWFEDGVHQPQKLGLGVHLAIADRASGALTGTIGLFRVDWSNLTCEVGYGMRPAWRRRGYATEALKLVVRWALHERGLYRVELRALTSNHASIRVAEYAGFLREGRARGAERSADGAHHDQVVFGLIARDLARDVPGAPDPGAAPSGPGSAG